MPTPLAPAVPSSATDSFPHLSTASAGQSFITEPPLPDSPTLTRRSSQRTVASRSTSLSVKSETKRMNRLAALACLEGRKSSSTGTFRRSHSNFISMSDDEDEDYPLVSSRRPSTDPGPEASKRLSTITASNIPMPTIISGGEMEVDPPFPHLLIPYPPQQSKTASVKHRHRSRTMESWFPPLANFIDLRNEEDSPNWRSFIEFSAPTA